MTNKEFDKYSSTTHKSRDGAYIASPWWQDKRKEAFDFHGRKCKHCGSTKNLQVHHLTYIRLFNEHMKDLEIACRSCHRAIHVLPNPKPTVKERIKRQRNKAKVNNRKGHPRNNSRPLAQGLVSDVPPQNWDAEEKHRAYRGHHELDCEWARMIRVGL